MSEPDELDADGRQPFGEGRVRPRRGVVDAGARPSAPGHEAGRRQERQLAESPTRRLEQDASAASYERFRACTAALDAEQLVWAYTSTWEWSRELMSELARRHAFALPGALLNKLNHHLGVD